MNNILILISGMPGTGKTTFANYLASELCIPLVSYDQIKSKEWEFLHNDLVKMNAESLYGIAAYNYFWFFCETIMKSHTPLIAEYFYHTQHEKTLQDMTIQYGYKTITVHFDSDMEVAYKRFIERDNSQERHSGLRNSNIEFEIYAKCAKPNKDFMFGEHRIIVNTNDFSKVSYEKIKEQIYNLF